MTNSTPAASRPTAAAMAMRRPVAAPTNSYASVLSGQARLSGFSSEPAAPGTGPSSRIPSHYSAAGSYTPSPQPIAQTVTVPSYLTESLYAERLASKTSSVFSQLPAVSASLGLSRKPPLSHRSLAFDLVEHVPAGDEHLSPLPARWNESDKSPSVEVLNDGAESKYIGPAKMSEQEAAAVRADSPMPPQCGLFYFEITVIAKGKEGSIGLGFCTAKVSLSKLPGWEQESWGYHGDDGNYFCCGTRKPYGPKFSTNDVIGCGINFRTKTAFFTKNGHNLGTAFRDINKGELYPVVGMKKEREHVRVNFGQDRFIFDIDNYMRSQKNSIYDEINTHPTANLYPPLDETSLVQALVSQYLAHDGYVKTARAFAEDIQKESRALNSSDTWKAFCPLDSKGDIDAVNRQRIRTAILEGDVDRALKLTNTFYPDVLKEKELLYFRLRRRKLVEMIRHAAESIRNSSTSAIVAEQSGLDDIFEQDMDIDDPSTAEIDWETMDVEDGDMGNTRAGDIKSGLNAAVEYGQKLRIEFSSDKRPEIKKALDEAVSLLAYTDPSSSVVAHLLDEDGRISDAEELNSAILVSLGKSSDAALERLIKQSSILIQDISQDGGPGSFINLRTDYLKSPRASY